MTLEEYNIIRLVPSLVFGKIISSLDQGSTIPRLAKSNIATSEKDLTALETACRPLHHCCSFYVIPLYKGIIVGVRHNTTDKEVLIGAGYNFERIAINNASIATGVLFGEFYSGIKEDRNDFHNTDLAGISQAISGWKDRQNEPR
jgi:hypothetical protein